MDRMSLPKGENIYEAKCPILYAMELIGQKWKLPILRYIADAENQTLRYRELVFPDFVILSDLSE